jgi:sodium-dependent phosphate cotransporter
LSGSIAFVEPVLTTTPESKPGLRETLRLIAFIFVALLLFVFALDLITASLHRLGADVVNTIIQATANPFTGLFIGLLITAMMQSSSATTSLVVALVASGSLTVQSSIPIIMGANVGTTITAIIVSLGFISKKKEFKRAVAAGSYHCFFNLLTVVILFPLEYYYGFLSSASVSIASYFSSQASSTTIPADHSSFLDPVVDVFLRTIPSGLVLIVFSMVLLFGSILLFRRIISDLLKARSPEAFSRFFFKNQAKSFGWGLLTTAAIRSSTITTSVVVPVVAKRIATLREAAPFILGANVGTTITGFIAAIMSGNVKSTLSIAIAHFLFNIIGVITFFPVAALRKIPLEFANGLGKLTLRYRLAGFVFLLLTFFFIPFMLIWFNQDTIKIVKATYQQINGDSTRYYHIISRMNTRTQSGEWAWYDGKENQLTEPRLIYPVYIKNSAFFIGTDMYLMNKPDFCWDGEDEHGRYNACVQNVLINYPIAGLTFDSVYVFRLIYSNESKDYISQRIYLNPANALILVREKMEKDSVIQKEQLVSFGPN